MSPRPVAAMVTRPAPPRRAASAASRAAPVIVAPPTTVTWPREYLWDCGRRRRQAPQLRQVGEGIRARPARSAAPGKPISASTSLAAQLAARQQQMARLQAEERDGQHRLRGIAAHRAGGAVQPARHIHRDHAPGGAQRVGDDAVHIARQAGAEHRVDHQVRARGLGRSERRAWSVPSAMRHRPRRSRRAAAPVRQPPPASPSCCSSRAATYPSPPLLPGPASTSVRHGRNRCAYRRATARPAFAISVGTATPNAGDAASARAISSGVSNSGRPASACNQSGSNVTR